MSKLRVVWPDQLIDALEVGDDFITVYCNSDQPGKEGSIQRKLFKELQELTSIESYHNPAKFHEVDDPRGDKWRAWKKKFGCHFHVVYGREVTTKDLENVYNIIGEYK